MGSLERRLSALEERYGVGSGMFNPVRDYEREQRELMEREAIKRLTEVELVILEELLQLRSEHPDLSGAEFYGLMTKAQHALERRWVRVLKEVKREFSEAPA